MTIGLLKVILFFPESHSLKERRMLLESLKTRLHNKFNVSVIETDNLDKWQKATLAIACLANFKNQANSTLSTVINFLENNNSQNILDYSMEVI